MDFRRGERVFLRDVLSSSDGIACHLFITKISGEAYGGMSISLSVKTVHKQNDERKANRPGIEKRKMEPSVNGEEHSVSPDGFTRIHLAGANDL